MPLIKHISKISYQGYWCLPDKHDSPLFGELIYEENKHLTLTIHGIFVDTNGHDIQSFPIIHGFIGDGTRLTLYNSHVISNEHIFPDFTVKEGTSKSYARGKSGISCSAAFVGIHINNKEGMVFDKLGLNFENQELWLGEEIIDIQANNLSRPDFQVIYNFPKIKEYELNNFKLKISYEYYTSPGLSCIDDVVNFQSVIGVDFNESKFIDEIYKIVIHIRNFISLFCGYPLNLNSISLIYRELDKNIGVNMLFHRKKFLPIYNPDIFPSHMITKFNQLSNPVKLLNNWFDKQNYLEPIFDLYFAIMYNPRMYITNRLLLLTQALETYHIRIADEREGIENEFLDNDKFDELKIYFTEIVEKFLEKETQQHFKIKIKYMNRKNLRKRLKEIINNFDYLENLLNINQREFVDKVVDTRNYYTHYDPEDLQKAIKLEELNPYINNLRIILATIILDEIGLSKNEIIEYIQRDRYSYDMFYIE